MMISIRNSFQAKLDELLLIAYGFSLLRLLGTQKVEEIVSENRDAEFKFSLEHRELGAIESQSQRFEDCLEATRAHPNAILRMVQAQFVQNWQGFLDDTFAQMVKAHFSGVHLWPTLGRRIRVQLDFRTDSAANLVQNIQERACEAFSVARYDERLKTLEKALGREVEGRLRESIKKHVVVRNLIQHNNGVVRARDIRDAGLTNRGITLIDAFGKPKEHRQGEDVVVTLWEVTALKEDLSRAAATLVPNDGEPTDERT